MSRVYRFFDWTNEDGLEGQVQVSYGPWGEPGDYWGKRDAPIMVSFEDASWMGVETADDFMRWFKLAITEAKRLHQPRHPEQQQRT
jgi:hypothetical protein